MGKRRRLFTSDLGTAVRLVMVFVASAALAVQSGQVGAEKPDVLLIMVDDLRPVLGCYGSTRVHTPNIDRLANRGVVFDRAYCQYAKCGTSRLSLLTGLRPDAIGVFSNNVRDVVHFRKANPSIQSLPRWLKDHGYETRSFGKIYHDGWDNPADWSVPSLPGREREMLEVVPDGAVHEPTVIADRFDCPVMQDPDVADNHLFAGRMADQVVSLLQAPREGAPRLMAVGFRRPHLPFVAPRRYFDLYKPDLKWLPVNRQPAPAAPLLGWFNSDGYAGSAKRVGLTMPKDPSRAQAIDWNGYELRSYQGVPNYGKMSDDTQVKLWHAYAACVSYVDAQVGRILDALDSTSAFRKTVVVLCSDHGWHLGEHSAWGKMTNFEVATRVPLIIAAPGLEASRTASIAELVDLYPTLCTLTGVAPPEYLQGEDLTPVLRGDSPQNTRAFSQYVRYGGQYMGRAVRTEDYRCVVWTEESSGKIVARELYDHRTDSAEIRNLASRPERVADMVALESLIADHFTE